MEGLDQISYADKNGQNNVRVGSVQAVVVPYAHDQNNAEISKTPGNVTNGSIHDAAVKTFDRKRI